MLDGTNKDIASNVGKHVEVKGTMSPASGASSTGTSGTAGSASSASGAANQHIQVTSVKAVPGGTCS
jgi:hypothetical protein